MRYIETIKIENGAIRQLNQHLNRMYASSGIEIADLDVPEEWRRGVVKCRILYSDTIESITFMNYVYPVIRSLRMVNSSDMEYDKKYADRSGLDKLFAQRNGCDDILIVRDGMITDSYFCNVVFENGDGLFTPEECLLRGTKRAQLIESGVITTRSISVVDIQRFTRVRLINAMIELEDDITVDIQSIF